ncbi:MAG: alanine/glycine:cation symporter family protein [Oligoflexales bacterium]
MNTQILDTLQILRNLVWSAPLLIFLTSVGIYLTWILKGLQFRYLIHSFRLSFTSGNASSKQGELTHFQALMTSLAAAIGTGNIAGVATAITAGGMGAVFWMWVFALFGMALKYSEAFLSVLYRQKNQQGEMSGGPMYVLSNGCNQKILGSCFAFLGVLATFGTGNMVQVNSVADAVGNLTPIPPLTTGILLALTTGWVLLGGVKSIGKISEIFVPVMASLYILCGLWVLFSQAHAIPEVFLTIFHSAFYGQAAIGGFLGSTVSAGIQAGIARGVFSNEAGLGTSSIASAATITDEPGHQALVSMTSVFIATIIVCTITALVIGVSGVLGNIDQATGLPLNGAPLAMAAFETGLPGGAACVALGLIFFAYSTILGWAYYGEKCLEYLAGEKWIPHYRVAYILVMIPASIWGLEVTWLLADIANGLMAIPNLIALILLSSVLKKESHRFLKTI